jgi:hypothetical protein
MSKGIFDKLMADSKDAAYRVAGTQIIKVAKTGLLNSLRSKGIENRHVQTISDFLDTEIGTAVLSTCVGVGFNYIPPFNKDKRAKTLAREFRVGGMALAGNLLADKVLTDLLPKMEAILGSLPQLSQNNKTKFRIEDVSGYEESEEPEPIKNSHRLDVWH